MNCLHYSIPGSSEIRHAVARLPFGASESARIDSPDHLSCHRLLDKLAEALLDPDKPEEIRADTVEAAEKIIKILSDDDRVRNCPDEYYGVRFLQAEARSAMDEYHENGDTSGFERLGWKLEQELHPDLIAGNSETSPAPETDSPTQANGPKSRPAPFCVSRAVIFLGLLLALIAGIFLTGMCSGGLGF